MGDDFFEEQAQGQYCILNVRVENIGDSSQPLFADNQYLLSADGVEYSSDSGATFANDPDGGFFEEINPGNAVEAAIVFDVPADASLTQAELHDSAFSGGVLVDLG